MPSDSHLLVEGPDDEHVIMALCAQHGLSRNFEIRAVGGLEKLLAGVPIWLKMAGIRALGIVVDADLDLDRRWQAVCGRLETAGYSGLPPQPDADGLVLSPPHRPRVGVWLMPDNRLPGTLEHFVAHLIPHDDPLAHKVEEFLDELEMAGLNRYKADDRAKAFIHTWLALQERPGRPMGQAITAHTLSHNDPLANRFVGWLSRLFR